MSDVNIVLFQGRLTQNPELRHTPSGVAVTDLSIANNRYVKRKQGEGYDTYTTFAKVTLWNKMAERFAAQLQKGDMVFVEGQLVDDSYEDKNGQKHNGRLKIDNVTRLNPLVKAKSNTSATPAEEEESTSTPEV